MDLIRIFCASFRFNSCATYPVETPGFGFDGSFQVLHPLTGEGKEVVPERPLGVRNVRGFVSWGEARRAGLGWQEFKVFHTSANEHLTLENGINRERKFGGIRLQ